MNYGISYVLPFFFLSTEGTRPNVSSYCPYNNHIFELCASRCYSNAVPKSVWVNVLRVNRSNIRGRPKPPVSHRAIAHTARLLTGFVCEGCILINLHFALNDYHIAQVFHERKDI